MILSDKDIERRVQENQLIAPYDAAQLQPSSYDIRLADRFLEYTVSATEAIEPRAPIEGRMREVVVKSGDQYVLNPGAFVLAASIEWFNFPNDLAGRLEGRSSWGRLGLVIHSSAGFFDPGFKGTATLELANLAPYPLLLTPRDRIGQMSFLALTSPCENPYQGKYLNQQKPTMSRISQDNK